MRDDTFGWDRPGIGDAAGRPVQADHMARIPPAVATAVTAAPADPAPVAAAHAGAGNRGWIAGGAGPDGDPDQPGPARR
jgi:hypothetical protein